MDSSDLVSPDLTYTLPPDGLVMPQQAQDMAILVFWGLAGLFSLWSLYLAVRNRDAMPVIILVAALLCVILEPISNVLGNVLHPPVGQINAFTVEGHPVPWHVVAAYGPLFSIIIFAFYGRFTEQSLTPAFWWKTALTVAVAFVLFVHFFLEAGVWMYYGVHGIKLGHVSAAMLSANTAVLVGLPLVVYVLLPVLEGWHKLLLIPLLPSVAVAIHTGVHAPAYMVLGQDTEAISRWIIHGGVLLSVLFGVVMLWTLIHIAYRAGAND